MKYNLDFKPLKIENGKYAIVAIISDENNQYNMTVPNYTFDDEKSAINFINNNRMSLLREFGISINNNSTSLVRVGNTESKEKEKSTTRQRTNSSSPRATKIEVSDPDENISYHYVKGEDGKYYVRVTYLKDKAIIENKPFDTPADARNYVKENHKAIEKIIYENKGKEKINNNSKDNNKDNNKAKNVPENNESNIWEVTVPEQNKDVKYYVVKSNDDYSDLYYVRVSLLDLNKDVDFPRTFFTRKGTIRYIENNYVKLEEKAYKKAGKEVSRTVVDNVEEVEEENQTRSNTDNKKLIGKLCIFGAGIVAGAILIGSCHSCAKGCKSATCNPTATAKVTFSPEPNATDEVVNVATQAPTQTPTQAPTEVPKVLSMSDIDLLAYNVFNEYVSKNANVKNTDNGAMTGSVITADDLVDVITILNINKLSTENYDLFSRLVSDKQPDAYFKNVDYLMANLIALNMQKHYVDKTNDGLIWFSPMMINNNDKEDVSSVEALIENIMAADLKDDKNTVQELTDKLIDTLENQTMLNRGDGFDRALYFELEVLSNCAKDTMTSTQRDTIRYIKETKRISTNMSIENILSDVKSVGCYSIFSTV